MNRRSLLYRRRRCCAARRVRQAGACRSARPEPASRPRRRHAPKAAEPLKVGFVYVSPVGDAGWTSQHHAGRLAMEKALGDKVKTTFVEKVPEGADAERVIRDLAQQGNTLIFTTSFGFMNPTIKVAEEFPNMKFEHATGYKTAANVNTYNARFYEGRYLAGMVAGEDEQDGHARLCGRVPDSRGAAGHQRVRARCARGEPEGAGAGGVGQQLVRPRQGARCGQHADGARCRRRHAPHRLDGDGCGRPRRRARWPSPTTRTCASSARTRSSRP